MSAISYGTAAFAASPSSPYGSGPSGLQSTIADDLDMIAHSLLADAKLIGCAPRHMISAETLTWLIEAQDNIARAIEKGRRS